MDCSRNVVGWFEIPVLDMQRAVKFYQAVFGYELHLENFGDLEMAWFPGDSNQPGSSGTLAKHQDYYKPTTDGVVIYFSSPTGDLANELAKVAPSGGQVIMPKTLIKEDIGYMAMFIDTEGNRIALHSIK